MRTWTKSVQVTPGGRSAGNTSKAQMSLKLAARGAMSLSGTRVENNIVSSGISTVAD